MNKGPQTRTVTPLDADTPLMVQAGVEKQLEESGWIGSLASYMASSAGSHVKGKVLDELKQLPQIIENSVYNIAIMAGKTAAEEFVGRISILLVDQGVKLATKQGAKYIIDYMTGAMLAQLLKCSILEDAAKKGLALTKTGDNSIQMFETYKPQILLVLSHFTSPALAQAYISSLEEYLPTDLINQLKSAGLIPKSGEKEQPWDKEKMNQATQLLKGTQFVKDFQHIAQNTKDKAIENINEAVQTVYGPIRPFIQGYWATIGAQTGQYFGRQAADAYIDGRIAPLVERYIGQLFSNQTLEEEQYSIYADYTDFRRHHGSLVHVRDREMENKINSALIQIAESKLGEDVTQQIEFSAFGVKAQVIDQLQQVEAQLHLPQGAMKKIFSSQRLTEEDLNQFNQDKHGYYASKFAKKTTDIASLIESAGRALLSIDHKKIAQTHLNALTLVKNEKDPKVVKSVLDDIHQKLNTYKTADKEEILRLLRNMVSKNGLMADIVSPTITKMKSEKSTTGLENDHTVVKYGGEKNYNYLLSPDYLNMMNSLLDFGFDINDFSPTFAANTMQIAIANACSQLNLAKDISPQQRKQLEDRQVQLLEYLKAAGGNPSAQTRMSGENGLNIAVFEGNKVVMNWLLNQPEWTQRLVEGRNKALETPLHIAFRAANRRYSRHNKEPGYIGQWLGGQTESDPNARDMHYEIARMLIRSGVSLTATDINGQTAFDLIKDDLTTFLDEPTRALLDKRLEQALGLADGPLLRGTQSEQDAQNEVRLLLLMGASSKLIQKKDLQLIADGKQPLVGKAICDGELIFAQNCLVNHGYDFDLLSQSHASEGFKLLDNTLKASEYQALFEAVLQRLQKEPNFKDMLDFVPPKSEGSPQSIPLLHNAILMGNEDACLKLLEKGVSSNLVDLQGSSPLLLAMQNGQWSICQALFEHGANPMLENLEGVSPASYWNSMIHTPLGTQAYTDLKVSMANALQFDTMMEQYISEEPAILMPTIKMIMQEQKSDSPALMKCLEEIFSKYPNVDFSSLQDSSGNTILHHAYYANTYADFMHWLLTDKHVNPLVENSHNESFKDLWNSSLNISMYQQDIRQNISNSLSKLKDTPQTQQPKPNMTAGYEKAREAASPLAESQALKRPIEVPDVTNSKKIKP